MTCLFGWIPRQTSGSPHDVAEAMRRSLAVNSSCTGAVWPGAGVAVGAMDLTPPAPAAVSPDGRLHLWAVGEVFSGLKDVETPGHVHDTVVREALLRAIAGRGPEALAGINGEFQIAIWDPLERSLLLACDRFGCLPLYWSETSEGFAFAGTVAAVLQAPGVSRDPDEQAIREAVSFGGFRLGDRTNVAAVRMLRGGRALTYTRATTDVRGFWNWPEPPQPSARRLDDLMDEAHALWQTAVRRRLHGANHPGTTLSGGLDSRAVLAEACAQGASMRALTYGMPRCDDARIARRAAARADAEWTFAPLYEHGWLDRRTGFISQTDGLVQLVDLLHFEHFDLHASMMDVSLSGYIGDAVCGDTFGEVVDASSVIQRLPYSGVVLGWTLDQAHAWAEEQIAKSAPSAPRFVVFDHKLPQAIHRIFQAPQRRIRVRRPFIDHDLFDFHARIEPSTRARVYHGMLRSRYPRLFARIPNQKTNAPVLTRPAHVQLRRIARFAGRRMRDVISRTGLAQPAPSRSYHDEERHWREPTVRAQIVGTILRPGSISAEIFGRSTLSAFLDEWFTRFNGPAQSVGALYVFEHYHHALPSAPRRDVASVAV